MSNSRLATEPDHWFLAFHRSAANRFVEWLACGEFKHISAFAYMPGYKAWLIYDVQMLGTRLQLVPHDEFLGLDWITHASILRVHRGGGRWSLASRLGFYCVPAVKHLLGLRCLALTPDGLYRHILRNGGVCIDGRRRHTPGPSDSG
jgi:hypothetical protein